MRMKKETGNFFISGIEKKKEKTNKISDFAFKHKIAFFFFFFFLTSISIIYYDSRFYFN